MGQNFNRTIWQITHPAGDIEFLCLGFSIITKANTLNSAMDGSHKSVKRGKSPLFNMNGQNCQFFEKNGNFFDFSEKSGNRKGNVNLFLYY
jgi:hypothetical protein